MATEWPKFGESTLHSVHLSISSLLVSSISSSIVGDIGALATALLAFHIGSLWLKASRSRPSSLPPPYQFFLVTHLITHASPFALIRFMVYAIGRLPKAWSTRRREPITHILAITAAVLLFLIGLSAGIKVVDVVLHDQVASTVLWQNQSTYINGQAFISPDCHNLTAWACPVLSRTDEASAGGRNDSSSFAVYEVPYDITHPNRSIAYAGVPATDPKLTASGQTIAVESKCDLYRPLCDVEDRNVLSCGGLGDPSGISYNTAVWDNRAEIFLTTASNITGTTFGIMGTSSNPFSSAGFMCFNDYSDIRYSDTNRTYDTPYVNWWMIGGGISNQPYILCFTFTCDTWVYDGRYSVTNGVTTLNHEELTLANQSATLAVSGTLAWLGRPPFDTYGYRYTQRYIDEQLQVDVSAAGNIYGNDSTRFAAELAQSLSNRLLGWSAGAITMASLAANVTVPVLALQIPLVTAGVFTGLHFLYALVILVLGISCFFLPTDYHTAIPLSDADEETGGVDLQGERQRPILASDLAVAQQRLSDGSTLVHEIIVQYNDMTNQALSRRRTADSRSETVSVNGDTPTLQSRKTNSLLRSFASLEDMEQHGSRESVRLGIRSDEGGPLRLHVHHS